MFIWCVLLVSVNFVLIKSENEHVKIWIKKDGPRNCAVSVEQKPHNKHIKLADGSSFTLTVRSNDSYILESYWTRGSKTVRLEDLNDTNINIKYEKKDKKTFSYKLVHTEKANSSLEGTWKFSFISLKNTEPWLFNLHQTINCVINITVEITGGPFVRSGHGTVGSPRELTEDSQQSKVIYILIVVISIIGVILIVQSVYIIRMKKTPPTNIANRPPLPLPAEEVTESTVSPSSGRRLQQHLPTAPPMSDLNPYTAPRSPNFLKGTYGNEGLDISDEIIRSPKFGRSQEEFLVPKKSFKTSKNHSVEDLRSPGFSRKRNAGPMLPNQLFKKNNSSDDDSDEEPKLPGFIRKQIEDKLANLPPKPLKNPKPLPRAPAAPPPEKQPALNPAIRTETVPPPPLPPLPQRKMPAYPVPGPFRPDHRLSDDEWQYEALKPSSNYLNNFHDSNYNNT